MADRPEPSDITLPGPSLHQPPDRLLIMREALGGEGRLASREPSWREGERRVNQAARFAATTRPRWSALVSVHIGGGNSRREAARRSGRSLPHIPSGGLSYVAQAGKRTARRHFSGTGICVVSLTSSITTSVLELRTPGSWRTSSPSSARWAFMSVTRALTR